MSIHDITEKMNKFNDFNAMLADALKVSLDG